ncbi:MAG TPA: hypothetical protein PLP07_11300 [Pyrinomonadaceae bacterium]|nr:hypothetical protein [Chloracidobacterium sp.]MBP9935489.1 hypothetical protein [Pyrinomonadaceae bacterium]MBK7801896.1 hypothetical protein [Chloracidobacterium sp.]MBK9437961.1 hypothetical protein [Chloracidobacterium sp.]MBK9765609.1 hypothetical protein [Chloracidobacterium sp.]
MSVNVVVHDTRLEGRTPISTASALSFDVDDSTHIEDFFDRVVRIADEHSGIGVLYLMCHGVTVLAENTTALLFCHELIAFTTVHHFARLRDKVDRIVILACHVAETSMTRHGDGDELCRHIALQAHAEVTAARETQTYSRSERCRFWFCEESPIEYGEWEGPVVVYGRDGNIITEFQNPSVWYDSDGDVHDPRREPRP